MDQEKIRQVREQQAKDKRAKEAAAQRAAQAQETQNAVHTNTVAGARATQAVASAVNQSTDKLSSEIQSSSKDIVQTLTEQNSGVQDALNNLVVATVLSKDPKLVEVVTNFTSLLENLASASKQLENNPLNDLPTVTKGLTKALNDFGSKITEKEDVDYTAAFASLEKAVNKLNIAPIVNVPKQDSVDLKPLISILESVEKAVKDNKIDIPSLNFDEVTAGLSEVRDSINNLSFPVPNYVLPFKDSTGKATQALVDTNGNQAATITDGTNTANVLKSDGTAAGNNALLTAPAVQTLTFTTSASGAQTILANTDVSHYTWVEVVFTSVGVGYAGNVVWSPNSGGTYSASASWGTGSNSPTGAVGTAVNTIYFSAVRSNYLQLNVTALTSGTLSGYITLRTSVPPYNTVSVNGSVGSNSATGSAVPANAFYIAGVNASGNLTGFNTQSTALDGASGNNALQTGQMLFNGTTYDRARLNEAVSLLASAARTTTQTSADLVNYNGASFLDVILDMTVVGTGSVTLTINGKDPASAKYYLILTGAAVITNSTNVYRVGIGRTAVANATVNDVLPRTFQIVVTANNANSATYSVGYNLTRG